MWGTAPEWSITDKTDRSYAATRCTVKRFVVLASFVAASIAIAQDDSTDTDALPPFSTPEPAPERQVEKPETPPVPQPTPSQEQVATPASELDTLVSLLEAVKEQDVEVKIGPPLPKPPRPPVPLPVPFILPPETPLDPPQVLLAPESTLEDLEETGAPEVPAPPE